MKEADPMPEPTRREALAATAGALAFTGLAHAEQDDKPKPEMLKEGKRKLTPQEEALNEQADRKRVIACGMTEAEADCWETVAKAAGKFFELPKIHPMDDHEVAHAIHVIQHKLLARPTYRKYLEMAKAEAKAMQEKK
jgi:hypothetical protein